MAKSHSEKEIKALVKKYGYIKVNIPESIESFRMGNGEGIWAVAVDDEGHNLHKQDATDGHITVVACNDSVFYPGEIVYGSEVVCILRGGKRPVAAWDALNGTKKAADNKKDTLKKMGYAS